MSCSTISYVSPKLRSARGYPRSITAGSTWAQRFTPLLADAARFARHSPGNRWHADETYVKTNEAWRYVNRAIDQHRQVIDVLVSARRDTDAAGGSSDGRCRR
jgi:transposase-like protein